MERVFKAIDQSTGREIYRARADKMGDFLDGLPPEVKREMSWAAKSGGCDIKECAEYRKNGPHQEMSK